MKITKAKAANISEIIKDGQHVIIIDNSKQKRVYKIQQDKTIEHYKTTIACNELIGQRYNGFFFVTDPGKKDGKLEEITDQKQLVKEHLVESAGSFLETGVEDEYGAEDLNQEEAAAQEVADPTGPASKIQRKEGMKHVGEAAGGKDEFEVVGDNRNFWDGNALQTVTPGQIEEMKEKKTGGKQIIETLIQNSNTFQQKTQFSREKWLRRKQ